ncbi:transposase [Kitasatospora sp. NPDC056138]|uniref:transposase n=1 Tax=Kitasatospora sp. NPDC056138 TaxID=3345724 RepID=UPI0035DA09BA
MLLDAQSLRAAAGVPAYTTGRDAAKKAPDRKHGPAVDALGLVIAAVVPAASAQDGTAGTALLDKAAAEPDAVGKAAADQGFKNTAVARGARKRASRSRRSRRSAQPGGRRVRSPARFVHPATTATALRTHDRLRSAETDISSCTALSRGRVTTGCRHAEAPQRTGSSGGSPAPTALRCLGHAPRDHGSGQHTHRITPRCGSLRSHPRRRPLLTVRHLPPVAVAAVAHMARLEM